MKIHFLVVIIQFAAAFSLEVEVKCTFTLLDSYKCLTEGVDVRDNQTSIKAIRGAHVSWKQNFDVTRLEYTSVWSTFLPNGFSSFLPMLHTMEVHDTPISALSRSNFVGLSGLVALSFENTKIAEIPADTFEDLFNLEELTIRKSTLKALQPEILLPLEKLRFFDAKHNQITRLSRDLFGGNQKIESINLSGNPLQEIHLNFTSFKNIAEVYLFGRGCINSYFVRKSSTVSLKHLQTLIQKRCQPDSV